MLQRSLQKLASLTNWLNETLSTIEEYLDQFETEADWQFLQFYTTVENWQWLSDGCSVEDVTYSICMSALSQTGKRVYQGLMLNLFLKNRMFRLV